ASGRTFTVSNNCPFTICIQIFTDLSASSTGVTPDYVTGWEAAPGTFVSFYVPDNWQAGHIWARRDCDFNDPNPATQCADGGCNGGLECDPHTGTAIPPVTVADFTLHGEDLVDYVDVSLVNGFNLPMRVGNDQGCGIPSCPVDLNPDCKLFACPAPLQGPYNSTGLPVGCKNACEANIDGDPANSPNCCTGQYSTAATCPASGVAYYSYFKGNCPDAYVFPYDESSGTAVWVCTPSIAANYQVAFCPSADQ
ncbi:uncharacterized protein PHACADRAFT_97058, partial [Phanerochaete carnosa HHB-10118-sp]